MERFDFPFHAMACTNRITMFAPSRAVAVAAASAAINEVNRIEAKYSRYRVDSVVSNINCQSGRGVPVEIDPETALLLDFAESCFVESGGLFDITSGVLRRVWDFSASAPPALAVIHSVLPLIGWSRVVRTAHSVMLPMAGMEIDFGGFGKEYAADRAAAVLLQHDVRHGFVDLGGDVVVTGPQFDQFPWSLGIRHPRPRPQPPHDENQFLATVSIASGAVATSGDYERYLEHNGRRYSHILNPLTGLSVNGLQCVTAFAPTCLVAGGITTIAMLKGEGSGPDSANTWLARLTAEGVGVKVLAVGALGVLAHYP